MVVLVTCINEEDPIKMKALECKQHHTVIFRRPIASNSVIGGLIWVTSELIQACMHVIVCCKNEKVPI